jgi:hypothetical protein
VRLHLSDRWKLWRWRAAGVLVSAQACRRCGYPVQALQGTICPECGADRNRTGTIGPVRKLLSPRQVKVTVWWLVVLVLAWAVDPLLLNWIPRQLTYYEDYELEPYSKLYSALSFRRSGNATGWPSLRPHIHTSTIARTSSTQPVINVYGRRFIVDLEVQPQTRQGSFSTNGIKRNGQRIPLGGRIGTVDGEFMETWLTLLVGDPAVNKAPLGVTVNVADLPAEAQELRQLLLSTDLIHGSTNRSSASRFARHLLGRRGPSKRRRGGPFAHWFGAHWDALEV